MNYLSGDYLSANYHARRVPAPGDPVLLAARLASVAKGEQYVAYEHADHWSIGLGTLAEVIVDRTHVRLAHDHGQRCLEWTDDPLPAVAALFDELPFQHWRAYGWASFELAYAWNGLTGRLDDGELLHLVIPRCEVRLRDGMALLRGPGTDRFAGLAELLAEPTPEPCYPVLPTDFIRDGAEEYRAAVASAIEEIEQKRLEKVILSRMVPVEDKVDLTATYVLGRRGNTPARSFLLDVGGVRAAGFSPETVVEVSADGRVETQPLAGTRALVGDAERDAAVRADLVSDPKEIVEHAIAVKEAYEELNSLCTPESVAVEDFMTVRPRGSVQHLASRLAGRLAPGRGPWDAFGTLFPAITASGVPKLAAYDSICRHEPARGLYSGAVLTLDSDGAMDAALVLRTVYQRDGLTWLRAGAGIVGQSTPDREFEETCEKLTSVARFLVPASATS